MHTSYDNVLAQAVAIDGDTTGYRYAVVTLTEDDTAVNPASTKRVLYGPGVVLYEVSPMSVNGYEFDNADGMNENARRIYDVLTSRERYSVDGTHDEHDVERWFVVDTITGDWIADAHDTQEQARAEAARLNAAQPA